MMILNITYNGLSVDYPVESNTHLADQDVRRIAAEAIRSGDVKGLHVANFPDNGFDQYVVDRFASPDRAERIFLRPKVPFGI